MVGRPGKFVGVQVKSTTIVNGGGYVCVIRKQGKAYTSGSFDFVAAYVVPEDVWYIIPVRDIRGRECMSLCSNSNRNENQKYREAWHLLREAADVGEEAETCAEEAAAPAAPEARFPRNALERMEAAANFVRRQMAGRSGDAAPKSGGIQSDDVRSDDLPNDDLRSEGPRSEDVRSDDAQSDDP